MTGVILTTGAAAIAVAAIVLAALYVGSRGRPFGAAEPGFVSLDALLDGDVDDGYEARHQVRNDQTVLIPVVQS